MGYMIEIEEKKMDKLSEHLEESLRHMGKAMSCIDTMMGGGYGDREDYGYGHRGGSSRYSGGSNYGSRGGSMGYRDDEDWDEMDERREDMMERRGRRRRDSRGRYM